jgi:hypothetical protein
MTELQNQYIALSTVNAGRTAGEFWFQSCREKRFISSTELSPGAVGLTQSFIQWMPVVERW